MSFDPKMAPVERIKHEKDGLDVWEDIFHFATAGFAEIAEPDIVRMRWYGIYQQKPNEGHFMWRIKLPGGRVTPAQLREIGQLSNEYGRGFGDITTRQDIQLHWLTIADFPDCLDRIYNKVGLYTDFACGDTPRNICSCPLDGIVRNQIVDFGDLVQRCSDMFREGAKEFSNLPRKFKTTLAACPLHCHQPQINDIGVFGVTRRRNGRDERGLGVMVGGGLSSVPMYAQGLRVFVPEEKVQRQIPEIFREIAHLFRDSDELRYKRKHARLKFLVAEKGWQWVRDELERRLGYELEHDEEIVNPQGALHTDHVGIGEQQDGLYYIGVPIARGRLSGDAMIAAADLAQRFAADGRGQVRLSQKQNLLLVNIPKSNVDELAKELTVAGLSPDAPRWRQTLVSCTGTEFCNLAVVETKERAREILEYLEKEVDLDTPLMVSVTGCPNACAQYQIADIGLTGTKATFNGQKVDAYDLLVGGTLGEEPKFGVEIVSKVPAPVIKKVIAALVKSYKQNRVVDKDGEAEPFRAFVGRIEATKLAEMAKIEEWTQPVSAAVAAAHGS